MTTVSPEGENKRPVEGGWPIPTFCLGAQDFLNYLTLNEKFGRYIQDENTIWQEQTLEASRSIILNTQLSPEEGIWEPEIISENQDIQKAFIISVGWRLQTAKDELIHRRSESLPLPEKVAVSEEINAMSIDEFIKTASQDFADLLQFSIVQMRREELTQKFFEEIGLYLYLKDDRTSLEQIYRREMFPNIQELELFIAEYAEIIDNPDVLQEIHSEMPVIYGGMPEENEVALQQCLYAHYTTSGANYTSTLISRYIEKLISGIPDTNTRRTILSYIGIPYFEEVMPSTLAIPVSNGTISYIAKYFSGMNFTHLGRDIEV